MKIAEDFDSRKIIKMRYICTHKYTGSVDSKLNINPKAALKRFKSDKLGKGLLSRAWYFVVI